MDVYQTQNDGNHRGVNESAKSLFIGFGHIISKIALLE